MGIKIKSENVDEGSVILNSSDIKAEGAGIDYVKNIYLTIEPGNLPILKIEQYTPSILPSGNDIPSFQYETRRFYLRNINIETACELVPEKRIKEQITKIQEEARSWIKIKESIEEFPDAISDLKI